MLVRILVSMGGQAPPWPANYGDLREIDPAEAARLIAAGFAEAVRDDAGTRETATVEPTETAAAARPASKRRSR